MKRRTIILFLCILFSTGMFHTALSDTEKKIFIVHSYSQEYKWVQEYTAGLKEELKKIPYRISYREFFMNAKKEPEKSREKGKEAFKEYKTMRPDIVIAADDAAQLYFVVPYLSNKVKTPVIFLGVNARPQTYGYPSQNVTGVLERANHAENLLLIHELVPLATSFVVIGDGGITFKQLMKRNVQVFHSSSLQLKDIFNTRSFGEWKKYILAIQKKTDSIYLLAYQSLVDSKGNWVSDKVALQWFLAHNRLPEVTQNLFSVKDGLLCSFGQTGAFYGRKAAHMVGAILQGQKVSDLPLIYPKRGLRVINRSRAYTLGFTIPSYLIPGTLFYE